VWLTPHLRDPQPEGKRERDKLRKYVSKSVYREHCRRTLMRRMRRYTSRCVLAL